MTKRRIIGGQDESWSGHKAWGGKIAGGRITSSATIQRLDQENEILQVKIIKKEHSPGDGPVAEEKNNYQGVLARK